MNAVRRWSGVALVATVGLTAASALGQVVPPTSELPPNRDPIIPRTVPGVRPGITDPANPVIPVPDMTREPGRQPAVPSPATPGDLPGDSAPGPMLSEAKTAPLTHTIPDQIASGAQFKVLAGLLKSSGLDKSLAAEGPYTLVAPYDKAFTDLPPDTLAALERPENADKLIAILKLHVLPGRLTVKELAPLDRVETLNGQAITVQAAPGRMALGGAKVLEANVPASNGVIHVIDKVIVP